MNVRFTGVVTSYLQLGGLLTGRIIPVSKLLGSPPFISHFHGHLEGVPQTYLGELQSPWLLTTLLVGMILQVLHPMSSTTKNHVCFFPGQGEGGRISSFVSKRGPRSGGGGCCTSPPFLGSCKHYTPTKTWLHKK